MAGIAKAATAALASRGLGLWSFPGVQPWVSALGTAEHAHLPHFLTSNPLPQGFPWGGRTTKNTDYYHDTPNTGVTRHYDWTISREPCNPDGLYENECLLVNGVFPGPTIEANWGDWIEVTVTNNIPNEGTSIHWHGLLQKSTPYMDGVPGNSQCPIAPGSTFTYRFQADLYGSSWYHSHWSAQYGSGLWGPMVIYGPASESCTYDADLGPVAISDYYHEYYEAAVQKSLANPASGLAGPPLANNNLINGKASNGTTPMASFNVTSGKTYRMRLINTSAASVQKFSIDGYTMTVFANDFVPIVPYETDVVTLAVGQRSDVLFKATGKSTDAVWMRAFRPPPCGPTAGGEVVTAAIFYEDADRSQVPTTQPGPNAFNTYCGNDPLSQTVPMYPMTPGEPSTTEILPIQFESNGTALLWYLANQTFRINYNDPILLEAKLGNLDFPAIESVHNYGTNKSLRFVIENPGNQPHPMHLHGHNIWVLQEGPCAGDGGIAGGPPGGPPASGAPPASTPAASGSPPASTPAASGSPPVASSGAASGPPPASSAAPVSASSVASSGPVSSAAPSAAPSAYPSQKAKRGDAPQGNCWDGTIVNAQNPQRRDVQMLPAASYIVIQWNQDNAGVWPLHCHIAWHLSAGMVWMVLEDPDAIRTQMQIPSIMAQTCRDWATWSGQNVVQQIDDGI